MDKTVLRNPPFYPRVAVMVREHRGRAQFWGAWALSLARAVGLERPRLVWILAISYQLWSNHTCSGMKEAEKSAGEVNRFLHRRSWWV